MFLAKLIIDYGTNFSGSQEIKHAAHFMTRTVLNQLDVKRRGILLRSLYDAKLITYKKYSGYLDQRSSIISLEQVDLSNIIFGLSSNIPNELERARYIQGYYLWLSRTVLINASFRHTTLDCVTFDEAIMDSADLSFAYHENGSCVTNLREGQTSFFRTKLINASLYKIYFRYTTFNGANLAFANMYGFRCLECNFLMAIFSNAHMSFFFYISYLRSS